VIDFIRVHYYDASYPIFKCGGQRDLGGRRADHPVELLQQKRPRLTPSPSYAVGFLYFLAPVAAFVFIFMPMRGMGLFGLKAGLGIMVHAIIVNAP
jgi:hypothetical protein